MSFTKFAVTILCALSLSACSEAKDESADAKPTEAAATAEPAAPASPADQYAAEAAVEITDDNAEAKAAALEKELEAELAE